MTQQGRNQPRQTIADLLSHPLPILSVVHFPNMKRFTQQTGHVVGGLCLVVQRREGMTVLVLIEMATIQGVVPIYIWRP